MPSEQRPEPAAPGGAVVWGFHPVRELLRHRPHTVAEVWLAFGRPNVRRSEVEQLCARHRIALREQPPRLLAEWAGGPHNGVLAFLRAAAPVSDPEPPVAAADPELVVLVEDVQDPRNLGALLRVCEGAGVGRVLLRDRGSAPITGVVEKTSAGAVSWVTIERITNSAQALRELKEDGFWVYGSDPAGVAPWSVALTGKLVLCIGGEQKGLRAHTRELCDGMIGAPMRGRIASLNLATAAAALLYEAVRQRTVGSAAEVRLPGREGSG